MMNYVNYAVVEATLGLDFVTKFDTLEEANAYAREVYDEMTDRDKEVYEVYVAGIDEDDHKTEIEDAFNSVVTYREEHPEAHKESANDADSDNDSKYVTYATVILGYRKPIYKTFATVEEAEADARNEFAHWNEYNKDMLQLFVVGIREQDIPENDSVFAYKHGYFSGYEIIPNTFNSMDAVRDEIKAQIRENDAEREAEQAKANAEKSAVEMMNKTAATEYISAVNPEITPETVSGYLLECWRAFCASDFGGGVMTLILGIAAKWLRYAAKITVKPYIDCGLYTKSDRKYRILISDSVCVQREYHVTNVHDIEANSILSAVANHYVPADRSIDDTLKMWAFKDGKFITVLMAMDVNCWSDINPLYIDDFGEVAIRPKYDGVAEALHECAVELSARIDADQRTTHIKHYNFTGADVKYFLHTRLYKMFPADSESDAEKRLELARWIDSTTINVIVPDNDDMHTVVIQSRDKSIQITHRVTDIKGLPAEVILSYALADYYKTRKNK